MSEAYEDQKNFREWLTFFLACIVACVGYNTYIGQKEKDRTEQSARQQQALEAQAKESRDRDRQYRIPFYTARINVYLELSNITARIAISGDIPQAHKQGARFMELFLGQMLTVSDNEVVVAMERFRIGLAKLGSSKEFMKPQDLHRLARDVSIACRDSLRKEFPFEALIEGRTIFGEQVGDLPPPPKN